MALGDARCAISGPSNALRWSCEVSPRIPTLVLQNIAGVNDLVPLYERLIEQRHCTCTHCIALLGTAARAKHTRSYVAFFPTKRQIPPGRGPVNTSLSPAILALAALFAGGSARRAAPPRPAASP